MKKLIFAALILYILSSILTTKAEDNLSYQYPSMELPEPGNNYQEHYVENNSYSFSN